MQLRPFSLITNMRMPNKAPHRGLPDHDPWGPRTACFPPSLYLGFRCADSTLPLPGTQVCRLPPPFTWDSGVKTVWPISSTNYPGEKKTRAGFGFEGQSRWSLSYAGVHGWAARPRIKSGLCQWEYWESCLEDQGDTQINWKLPVNIFH